MDEELPELPDLPEEEPLGEDDRVQLQQDLDDVVALKAMLAPRGIKGVVHFCADCETDHYLTWDLLESNLSAVLREGSFPVHEPAFAPDPDEYVTLDYGRGYLDGYETVKDEEFSELAMRLVLQLRDRGWRTDEIKSMMAGMQLDVPGIDDPALEDGST